MARFKSIVTGPFRLFMWLNYFSARKYQTDDASDPFRVNVATGKTPGEAADSVRSQYREAGGTIQDGIVNGGPWSGGPGGYGS